MHRDVNTKFAEFLSSRHLRKGVLILSFWNEYDLRAIYILKIKRLATACLLLMANVN